MKGSFEGRRMNGSRAVRLNKAKNVKSAQIVATRDYPKLLEFKSRKMFPDANTRMQALRILERYGMTQDEPDPERVRLAILKLSGVDLQEMERTTTGAKEDFEDIVLWAECPAQTRCALANRKSSAIELNKLQEQDRREYDEWLTRASKPEA